MNKQTKTALSPKMDCRLSANSEMKIASDMQTDAINGDFPQGVSRPALRALISAGYSVLDQLVEATEVDLLILHGMGPMAMRILRQALREQSLNFREGN